MDPIVQVRHATGSYPVYVDAGALTGLGALARRLLPDRRPVVITDRTVARLVPHGLDVPTLIVAAGEQSKSRTRWSALTDQLLALGFGRDAGVLALGGGVVGDLAGFVAATYHRGVAWLSIPTSLLAMVDASVGGKTGVNTPLGKNLVGAFHPPVAVVADPKVLRTLRPAHRRAGLVEALKHGLVADSEYFGWITAHAGPLLKGDPARLGELVTRSVRIKAAIVMEDEREQGRRAVLNAGHTVGHAIEQTSDYAILHGEAVGIGLAVEARLAQRSGIAARDLVDEVTGALAALGCATTLRAEWSTESLLAAMHRDKKARGNELRFALPERIGAMAGGDRNWTVPVSEAIVRDVLECSRGGGEPSR